MLCVFLLCDDLLCQSFHLLFSMNFSNNSCVFQIVHGDNLFQLFFVLINSCLCIFYIYFILFSGVGDIFFSLYNVSLILISLINSFVIHGFLFVYLIFVFSNGKNYIKILLYSIHKDCKQLGYCFYLIDTQRCPIG